MNPIRQDWISYLPIYPQTHEKISKKDAWAKGEEMLGTDASSKSGEIL